MGALCRSRKLRAAKLFCHCTGLLQDQEGTERRGNRSKYVEDELVGMFRISCMDWRSNYDGNVPIWSILLKIIRDDWSGKRAFHGFPVLVENETHLSIRSIPCLSRTQTQVQIPSPDLLMPWWSTGPMAPFNAIMPIKIYIGIVPCDINIMSYHHDQKWKCGRQHHTTVM